MVTLFSIQNVITEHVHISTYRICLLQFEFQVPWQQEKQTGWNIIFCKLRCLKKYILSLNNIIFVCLR